MSSSPLAATTEPRLAGDLAIWIFILAELGAFAAFFGAYAFTRANHLADFNAAQLSLNRDAGALNTVLLLSASGLVVRAVQGALANEGPRAARWMLAAIACGLGFLFVKVRLVSSGTEATMSAIRLARGYTGRDVLIKFEGCYHGHSDSLLVKAGSGALTFGNPSSGGVPDDLAKHTMVLAYNDPQQLADAFAQHGDKIAAVIVEPVVGNMNLIAPTQAFLDAMRALTAQHGAVLIFDEVMTGFRVGLGSAQANASTLLP